MVIVNWYSAMHHLKPGVLVNLFEVNALIIYQYLMNPFEGCSFKKSREMNGFLFLHFRLNGKIKISSLEFSLDQRYLLSFAVIVLFVCLHSSLYDTCLINDYFD